MIYNFLIKRLLVQTKELTEELHKSINRKFEKRKVHSFSINRIWSADLADMQL